MTRLDDLRGMPAHRLVQVAGLPMSLAQVTMLRAIEGAELDRAQRSMFRTLTHTHWPTRPRSEGYRDAYLRLGRRSGKSTRICAPLAVAGLLARVDHLLAPGETARVLLVAPNRDQTRTLLDASAGLLDLLGIPHERLTSAVRVEGLRVTIETTTADAVAPRGPTAVLVVVDEAALLPFEAGAEGNDRELVAALRPTLATTKGRFVMASTPWGRSGIHFERVEEHLGSAGGRAVAFAAPTWIVNPTITEEQTREEEPDDRTWRREWAAIPGDVDSAAFSSSDLDACLDEAIRYRDPTPGTSYSIGYDEGGRQSARALVVTHKEFRKREGVVVEVVVQDLVRRWPPGSGVDHDAVMREVATISRRYNRARVLRDLFAGDAVSSALQRHGVRSEEASMSPQAQAQRFRDLQALIETHRIRLIPDPQLIGELRGLRETLHQGGRVTFSKGGRRGEFDDLADALALSVARALSLPPSGGNGIVYVPPRITKTLGNITQTGGYYAQRTPSGQLVPIPMPDSDPRFEEARAARWRRGMFTPDEATELGDAGMRRAIESGDD